MKMYAWEVLTRNEFDNLFSLKVKKVPPKYFSDHWLTGGEIWSLCGLDKYGKLKREIPEKRPFAIC